MAGYQLQHQECVKQKLRELIEQHTKTRPGGPIAHVFTVPDELRIGNEQHFDPKRFSIGLIHAQDEKLRSNRGMKINYLYYFMRDLIFDRKELVISLLSSRVNNFIAYYDLEPDKVKGKNWGDEVLEILLLDACFIVRLLMAFDWENPSAGLCLRKEVEILLTTLRQDLLKFENQIPFSILADLAAIAFPNYQDSRKKLIESALHFFQFPAPTTKTLEGLENIENLLELALLSQFPRLSGSTLPKATLSECEKILNKARTASDLEYYGIKFRAKDTAEMADIEFKNGVLKIPRLEIDANFPSMAWNFIIFESYRETGIFLSYVILMDTLIRSEEDVKVLIRAGVLKVWFNDMQLVASLFDMLSTNLEISGFHFTELLKDLNAYCDTFTRRLRADVVRRYHADRWDMANSILLFILTVTQTLFSILSYEPKKPTGGKKLH